MSTIAPFLTPGQWEKNLSILAHPQFALFPKTSCMTKEVYQKIPKSWGYHQCIQWSSTLGPSAALIGLFSTIFNRTTSCLFMSDNWQSEFFAKYAKCFRNACTTLSHRAPLFWALYNVSRAALFGIACHNLAQWLVQRNINHINPLRQEYIAIAQHIKDPIQERRLQCNLPILQQRLKAIAQLDDKTIEHLVLPLKFTVIKV